LTLIVDLLKLNLCFEGIPECKSNFDCVVGGVCIKDRAGLGRCYCSSSCSYSLFYFIFYFGDGWAQTYTWA